ncbi:ELMO domain-containing protein 3 [Bulinus truncatus]|nr:ELMO domain-containing protein 3 [Bulinus truncatus]
MDDLHQQGVSLNELIVELKEEDDILPEQSPWSQGTNAHTVSKDIFSSQSYENKTTNNESFNPDDFEDCCTDTPAHLLFNKSKDSLSCNDSDLEYDFPEKTHFTVIENREIESDNVVLIKDSRPFLEDPSTSSIQNIFLGHHDNENKDQQADYIISTSHAAEEWDCVQCIQPNIVHSDTFQQGSVVEFEPKPLVTFTQIWLQFESTDYSVVKDQIKTGINRQGLSAFIHILFGPPKLHRDLLPQRDLLFCIAATSFQNDNVIHNQVLQTIYRCLTGSKFECQRYGSHWEEIGFQGQDPATDLRGSGMLALLHILSFLRDSSTKELARDIYKLSLHPTQNFPFCVMGINLTRICLHILREDIVNKECNKRKDVVGTMNCIYASLFLHLYNKWKKGKTIVDSGFILSDTEGYARKHLKTLLKDFEDNKKLTKQSNRPEENQQEMTFLSICQKEELKTDELY